MVLFHDSFIRIERLRLFVSTKISILPSIYIPLYFTNVLYHYYYNFFSICHYASLLMSLKWNIMQPTTRVRFALKVRMFSEDIIKVWFHRCVHLFSLFPNLFCQNSQLLKTRPHFAKLYCTTKSISFIEYWENWFRWTKYLSWNNNNSLPYDRMHDQKGEERLTKIVKFIITQLPKSDCIHSKFICFLWKEKYRKHIPGRGW